MIARPKIAGTRLHAPADNTVGNAIHFPVRLALGFSFAKNRIAIGAMVAWFVPVGASGTGTKLADWFAMDLLLHILDRGPTTHHVIVETIQTRVTTTQEHCCGEQTRQSDGFCCRTSGYLTT